MNVLITSCSAKVRLVRSFKEAFHPHGGKVFACDISSESAALFEADAGIVVPLTSNPSFIPIMEKLCLENSITLLVPTRNEELYLFAELSDNLRNGGTTVLTPSKKTLDLCLNKKEFNKFCTTNGFPIAQEINAEEIPAFPVFARPIEGSGSKGIMRINNIDEWNAILKNVESFVIQQFIQDPEYSIDVLLDLKSKPLQAVSRRRIEIIDGESSKGRIENDELLEQMSLDLCSKMGCIGHNVVQAFKSETGDIKIIEVNPRFGGGSSLSISAGLDSPSRLAELLSGNYEAAAIKRSIHHGLTMLRFSDDILVDEDGFSSLTQASAK